MRSCRRSQGGARRDFLSPPFPFRSMRGKTLGGSRFGSTTDPFSSPPFFYVTSPIGRGPSKSALPFPPPQISFLFFFFFFSQLANGIPILHGQLLSRAIFNAWFFLPPLFSFPSPPAIRNSRERVLKTVARYTRLKEPSLSPSPPFSSTRHAVSKTMLELIGQKACPSRPSRPLPLLFSFSSYYLVRYKESGGKNHGGKLIYSPLPPSFFFPFPPPISASIWETEYQGPAPGAWFFFFSPPSLPPGNKSLEELPRIIERPSR